MKCKNRRISGLRCLVNLCVLLSAVVALASAESPSSIANLLSPIRNFAPSWAASAAQGTTIAIPCTFLTKKDGVKSKQDEHSSCRRENAVVLILRSTKAPNPTISKPNGDENDATVPETLYGLRLLPPTYKSGDDFTMNQLSRRWTFLGSSAVSSMTGFAPDVDYLTRYLQKEVDEHRIVYESTTSRRTVMPAIQIVHALADEMQEAGRSQGGRPYGVQALIIGRQGASGRRNTATQSLPLRIFSLDPSGAYRSWGGGTAIGRNAADVRKQLYECLVQANKKDSTSKEYSESPALRALEIGLRASVEAMKEASAHAELSDEYVALVLWQNDDSHLCVATVDPEQVNEVLERIREMVDSDGKSSSTA